MSYEYKCVGAPERAKRVRGARTRTERVASAMEELINDEAVGGWEYLRTDLVPIEEKPNFFSRPQEVHRAVLIFRRPTVIASAVHRGGPAPGYPEHAGHHQGGYEPQEPTLRLSPEMETRRPVRRPPSGLG